MKTPIFNIHDLILVLTVAVCLLLAMFQLVLSKQKRIASQLLILFFLCVGLNALFNLFLWNDLLHTESQILQLAITYGLMLAILGKSGSLYFYVVATTRKDFQFRKQDSFHLINLFILLSMLLFGHIGSDELRFISNTQTDGNILLTRFIWHYVKLLPVVYAFLALIAIQQYKRQLKDFYSSVSLEGPQWLMLLALGFALNWLWSLTIHIAGQFAVVAEVDRFGIVDNYLTFILVNALFIYSMRYAHQLLETRNITREKTSIDTMELSQELIDKIVQGMETQKLYLKNNLNIEEFSKQVGINYREVSNIINKHFNTNFFEFVNLYRVNKARELLVDPKLTQTTIVDIFLESGFNSKSAFQRFFKRYTGMSAADYRKHHAAKHQATDRVN